MASWDKLFLVGDIVDTWICPHDVQPPTAIEILGAAHNQPIVEGIREFARHTEKETYWIEGNHDAGAGIAAAHFIDPNVCWATRYDDGPLYVRHGHETSLFNAKDPKARPFPLGYYLSRLCATASGKGLGSIGFNFQLIWDCKEKLVEVLEGKGLVNGVFAAVRDEARVDPNASFVMYGGGKISLCDVQTQFQNLLHDWEAAGLGDWKRAIESEYDPFYGINEHGDILYIAGHSHDKHYGFLSMSRPESRYVNLGSWCDEEASYATITLDAEGRIVPKDAHLATWGSSIVEPAPLIPITGTPKIAVVPAAPH